MIQEKGIYGVVCKKSSRNINISGEPSKTEAMGINILIDTEVSEAITAFIRNFAS